MRYPEIFITGKLPEKFGEGLILIGDKLGIVATSDNLMKYADNFIKKVKQK